MTHGIYLILKTPSLAFVMVSALQTRLGESKKFRVGRHNGFWYVAI